MATRGTLGSVGASKGMLEMILSITTSTPASILVASISPTTGVSTVIGPFTMTSASSTSWIVGARARLMDLVKGATRLLMWAGKVRV